MPRINLLPWREQERKERKLRFFIALAAAAGAAVLATFGGYLLFGSMIDAQEARNDRLRSQIKVLDRQIEQINDLEQQKQKFISRMQIIDKLQRSRPEVVHVFDQLVKTLPDGVYLTAVTQTDQRLKIQGVAQSSTRVSTFMRNIAASQWLTDPELEVVETGKANTQGSTFVLDANQVNPAGDDDDAARPGARRNARAATTGGHR